jgi:hypothetical protein
LSSNFPSLPGCFVQRDPSLLTRLCVS